ncbi:hypothetical protein Pth03_67450 [Planotetraspora thailandica]|uniref:Bacterial spore germination immunoglobulin-like domain-containing protein n=1 Tax=Planotetraspora thailandica TaxID=487172 RepID=A0A8J3Y062_9ACTN|nr:hypothetical protein [Planotetraspora thailandica]GII58356.1 hypothetical protein Pth03_67450 [Planotetraspora thailandica]
MRWRLTAGLVSLVVMTACGADAEIPLPPEPTASGAPVGESVAEPPPVVMRGGGRQVSLRAFTYCYRNTCADGRPEHLPDLGSVAGEITLSSPLKGWTFEATLRQPATAWPEPCDVRIPARLVPASPQTWRLEPAGPAGSYRIDVSGRGPDGGDLFAAFAVTLMRSGPAPEPRASLSAFHDNQGEADNYGSFELAVAHLGETPREATATLTVTGRNGRAAYELARQDDGCQARGEAAFRAEVPIEKVRGAVGREPYTIGVELVLDGRRHTATVAWPGGVGSDPDAGDALTPVFTPALR